MHAITFPVDPVRPADEPLAEADYADALALHIAGGHDWRRDLEQRDRLRELIAKAEREKNTRDLDFARMALRHREQSLLEPIHLEACSRHIGRLVKEPDGHPFLRAVMLAYALHRRLTISPDMIWLLIAQGAAAHIRANAEKLRATFVTHEGQKELLITRDDFVLGSPDNPWPVVFSAFSARVAEHVGPRTHAFFVSSFSTTGPCERAAFEVTLLDAMREYFRYAVRFVCGIPEVTLQGTPDDWREIASRVEWLGDIGLARWRDMLRPVLRQFARASRGDIDTGFWRRIYVFTKPSCDFTKRARLPTVTGWIATFFPYLSGRVGPPRPAGWLFAESGTVGLAPSDAGSGMSVAPFLLRAGGAETQMEFMAGFVGVAQDAGTLALRPEIGWAVRQAPPEESPLPADEIEGPAPAHMRPRGSEVL
jgi:hypothetical protein